MTPTRYQICDEQDRSVVTFAASGRFHPVTYDSMTEATLALIFHYGDRPELRVRPVADPLPKAPRIES